MLCPSFLTRAAAHTVRQPFLVLACAAILSGHTGLALALSTPGPSLPSVSVPDDGEDDYAALVKRQLSTVGDDRDRIVSGVIDPTGYMRVTFDGMPVQVLEALPAIGGQIAVVGPDPADLDREIRTVRFDDRALSAYGGGRFQARDRLILTLSIGNRGRGIIRMVKSDLANVKPGSEPAPK